MNANITNLVAKNAIDHTCMPPNTDNAIECAPSIYCRILVVNFYQCVLLDYTIAS